MLKPLTGLHVIELAGLAPVPLCGRILADFGASVTVINRKTVNVNSAILLGNVSQSNEPLTQKMQRGKSNMDLDLKNAEDLAALKNLCVHSDVLLDPFRPGVLERMGLDPVKLIEENKKLIVARVTGYGQTGEMAKNAGHDLNYVALSGMLPAMNGLPSRNGAEKQFPPFTPANFAADMAGGGLLAAFGVAMALYQCKINENNGCIIDCSMTEGVSYICSFMPFYKNRPLLSWENPYALLSGTCPIYRTYETSDGKFMAVGCLEKKFQDEFFKNVDACVTPVLGLDNVGDFSQHQQRHNFVKFSEGNQEPEWIPQPAPRLHLPGDFAKLRDENVVKYDKEKSKM